MAARFWVGGHPTNNNWNQTGSATTNWSATSGGAAGASVPGASDDVTFDGAGANGNSNSTVSATITGLTLTFTSGYTQTVTINTGVTLNVAGSLTDHTNHSWVVNGTGSLGITTSSTITSGGKTFPGPVIFGGATTKTLVGNWVITGTLTINAGTTLNWTTNESISIGGLTMSSSLTGTALVIITGGTWSGTNPIRNNFDIAGNVTVSGSVFKDTNRIRYLSGVVTTTGSTLNFGAANSTTFDTNGMTWNNITLITGTYTVTLDSLLSVSGTLATGASVTGTLTFAGAAGFNVSTFTINFTAAVTLSLANTVTYTVYTAFNCFASRTGAIALITSDHGTNRANLVLKNATTSNNVLASFTRIDARGGRPIITFNGTITDCINVYNQTNVLYIPPKSFNRGSRRLQLSNKNKAVIFTA